ncbi:MAG: hypothetical protein JXR73_16550 [Candidatus Omnitrophica bacterium]|nr:hypothetical protein [Candidatus Omnitrophota bacterium]
MADILTLPASGAPSNISRPRYGDRLETAGDHWIRLEKRLLDQAEFFEAMILVLNDVKLTNIQNRDYAMMEIVSEEIPRYKERLDEVKKSLFDLRREYQETAQAARSVMN